MRPPRVSPPLALAVLAVLPAGVLAGPADGPAGGVAPAAEVEYPARAVLEGVPRVGYDVHLCPFPGSVYAALEYLGEPVGYDYLMGASGAAFRRAWNRDDGGNVDLMRFQPGPYARLFAALGYDFVAVPMSDKAAMIQAVKRSIAAGRPVLAFVLTGPPECGVVAGYDRDGETLIGWSYFQEGADGGYAEMPGWFEARGVGPDAGLIVLGDKQPTAPAPRETVAAALEWAVDLARTERRPECKDHVCGLAAYSAWADALEVDADYPAEEPETMATRMMIHGDQCVMLTERSSAAAFLRAMAEEAPEAALQLEAAANACDRVADYIGKVWPWPGVLGPAAQAGLGGADTRRELARQVREAGAVEAEAVALLEEALAILRR
jgi:hypothetical protein